MRTREKVWGIVLIVFGSTFISLGFLWTILDLIGWDYYLLLHSPKMLFLGTLGAILLIIGIFLTVTGRMMRTRVLVGVSLCAPAVPLLALGILWIYEGVTTWDFHTGVIESVGFFLFLLPGLILVSIGIPLIVTKKKDIQPQKIQPQKIQPQKTTVQTKLELAQKNLEKSRYIKAGRDFREVAQIYEIQKDFNAIIYYKRAAESYHASKNYGAFFNFLKKRVMRAKIELGAKVEILKDSANKLLQAGEPKRAADLVQKIRSLYQEEPLRDAEKAQYYDQLARQLEDGLIGEIEIDRRYRDL